jgi:hypothetical protein
MRPSRPSKFCKELKPNSWLLNWGPNFCRIRPTTFFLYKPHK